MKLENTSFTREHSSAEEKARASKKFTTTDDIWTRKRGNDDQITELFVAMARAAGMKAYLAAVTNRDRSLFLPAYLSLSQLDDFSPSSTSTAKNSSSTPAPASVPTSISPGSTP